MKKEKIIVGFLSLLILINVTSADLINPGYKPIKISNKITNINDFPDYVFISGSDLDNNFFMCEYSEIANDGIVDIGWCYKYDALSVYAIPREKFDSEKIKQINEKSYNLTETREYFDSIGAIKILEDLEHYKEVPVSSTKEEINNFYEVSFDEIKSEPSKKEINHDSKIYLYPIISLIAIAIIILLVVKKRGMKNVV